MQETLNFKQKENELKKLSIKELNADELLSNLSCQTTNSYIFRALNGNKLTCCCSNQPRINSNLSPLNFNTNKNFSLTIESKANDESLSDKNSQNSKESSVVENERLIDIKNLFNAEAISERTEDSQAEKSLNDESSSSILKKPVNTFKIQLENVLPNNVKEIKESTLENQVKKHDQFEHVKRQEKDKPNGVIIMAPDGKMMKIGQSLNEELINLEEKKKNNTLYRLFDKIPPYLYYTNKIDTSLDIENEINKGCFFFNLKIRKKKILFLFKRKCRII